MIRYNLQCPDEHVFEAWFRSSKDYTRQRKRRLVACPACGSARVSKAVMAPNIASGSGKGAEAGTMAQAAVALRGQMEALRQHVVDNCENVGEKFPEEARKIHYGEAEPKGIYGTASREDVKDLNEEGVDVHPLPIPPRTDS